MRLELSSVHCQSTDAEMHASTWPSDRNTFRLLSQPHERMHVSPCLSLCLSLHLSSTRLLYNLEDNTSGSIDGPVKKEKGAEMLNGVRIKSADS